MVEVEGDKLTHYKKWVRKRDHLYNSYEYHNDGMEIELFEDDNPVYRGLSHWAWMIRNGKTMQEDDISVKTTKLIEKIEWS